MIRLIALLTVCVMMLSGCGGTNDTNNDGITGNDNADKGNVVGSNTDKNKPDKNTADNGIINDTNATDETGMGTRSSNNMADRAMNGVGNAMNGVGNAMEDIGRGANNVMHDVGNAMR
ncbi:MAG: hypothetical protein IKU60_00015 [Clostridia bacterium]|nr:hypothetical protein [Clostridia bacterium]